MLLRVLSARLKRLCFVLNAARSHGKLVSKRVNEHIFFIHSSVDGHLGCVHVLAIVNNAAMNTGVHVSFRIMVFSRYMPRSGIAGSYGSSILSFLRRCGTYIQWNITQP